MKAYVTKGSKGLTVSEEEAMYLKNKCGYKIEHLIPETIVEADELEGHPYPGHETWED